MMNKKIIEKILNLYKLVDHTEVEITNLTNYLTRFNCDIIKSVYGYKLSQRLAVKSRLGRLIKYYESKIETEKGNVKWVISQNCGHKITVYDENTAKLICELCEKKATVSVYLNDELIVTEDANVIF